MEWHGERYAMWEKMKAIRPLVYVAPPVKNDDGPKADGRVNDSAWEHAPWSTLFADIEGEAKPMPRYNTRVKMMWDDSGLWVGSWMDEPHLMAEATEINQYIFHYDHDFEVFINCDGSTHHYYEYEVNANNIRWELTLDKPYSDGGSPTTFNLPNIQTGTDVHGSLNDPSDTDIGWGITAHFPFKDLFALVGQEAAKPKAGDWWRINFSRVEWPLEVVNGSYVKKPPEDNWTWTPQGIVNMHRPERWGFVVFAESPSSEADPSIPDPLFDHKESLLQVYHYQVDYHSFYKRYATSLEDLGLTQTSPPIVIELTDQEDGYRASIEVDEGAEASDPEQQERRKKVSIRADGLLSVDVETRHQEDARATPQ
ncbi:unnamed protein product [Vitrella brassicaformis CCMP3155]|uniref:Carbohydrate-binding domain-containing protein n=1 Tax=Vitrella brassicaformis (strain CCMP3155) TaxID=1169540 RepID=A0A0G4EKB8_VITBC|nr:unnamed protein product [Vitrella brassicaformis CCMP3155]|eukprot:CEL97005.1 unnamed protein product [Vitrella brassicaformis CCMP3155]